MHIKIYTTGGSIDKTYSTRESNFVVGAPQVDQILKEANVSAAYTIEALFSKDSLDLSDADRRVILNKVRSTPERHILITHGTDTMIATARLLGAVSGKVIVLTGAMQPAAFKLSDAAFNVGGAMIALQTLLDGVYIVMNGKVFDPFAARKNLELDRFEASET
jgi:L-asparaginase